MSRHGYKHYENITCGCHHVTSHTDKKNADIPFGTNVMDLRQCECYKKNGDFLFAVEKAEIKKMMG